MTTERQIAANRANAERSTGPRTVDGKARSSQNAIRHGLGSVAPVIPRFETRASWDAHLAATLANLDPHGAVEVALAERAALILWRLRRVARYEREVTAIGRERAPDDLAARDAGAPAEHADSPPPDPRPALAAARVRHRALRRLVSLPPETPVTGRFTLAVVKPVLELVPQVDLPAVSVPDIIPDDAHVERFPDWTADRLRRFVRAIEAVAACPPDTLLPRALAQAHADYTTRLLDAREFDRRAGQLRRERILPAGRDLDRIIRFESHLSRQLTTTLAHLRQLQHARATPAAAESSPPPAEHVAHHPPATHADDHPLPGPPC